MTRPLEIIGHRGARGLFPENTIEGFQHAHDLGLRCFETDVGMTADGVVVLSHDMALNPDITRDASGHYLSGATPLIRDLTYAALRAYDVGRVKPASIYRIAHRSQRPCDGAKIPSLEEALRRFPDSRFIIELKTDPRYPRRSVPPAVLADAVLAVVDTAGAAGRVILESFDWRGPRHIRRIRPGIALAWLTRAGTVRDAPLWWDGQTPAAFNDSVPATVAAQMGTGARDGNPPIWAPAFETLSHRMVREARALGVTVIPWTVNRRAAMRRLIDWAVDGLITDRPDKAMAIVDEHRDVRNGLARRGPSAPGSHQAS